MLNGISQTPVSGGSVDSPAERRLERTCREFESIFLSHLLKSMRKTVPGGGLFLNNNVGEIMKSMFDENLALEIAKGGGIGLGRMLFERLKG